MYRDARQPGDELGAPFKAGQILIGANIGVLHDILGFGIVAKYGPRHPVKPLIVPAHQQLVQGGLALQDPLDDLLIAPILAFRLLQQCRTGHEFPPTPIESTAPGVVTECTHSGAVGLLKPSCGWLAAACKRGPADHEFRRLYRRHANYEHQPPVVDIIWGDCSQRRVQVSAWRSLRYKTHVADNNGYNFDLRVASAMTSVTPL